jgi:predicted DCC family thiol-disulfide oxidoreductase YuxK
VVYVKGRRAGGTHGAVNKLVQIAHLHKGSRHLWMDTIQRNIERYLRRYFFDALRGTRYHWNQQRKTLTFEGGAYCDFGSASRPENLDHNT